LGDNGGQESLSCRNQVLIIWFPEVEKRARRQRDNGELQLRKAGDDMS